MRKKSNIALYVIGIFLTAVAGVLLWGALNRQWVYDWWRGMGYEPTDEMGRIMGKLELTERGEFLFKASTPRLSGSGEFNAVCRNGQDEEMAVLGCYTGDSIYIYNIQSEELKGIRELTTAHELLHAVWARMREEEREALKPSLATVLEQNRDALGEELDNYHTSEQQEELYVRAGTEVKELPEALEKHYAEIFKNQDLIASYYAGYITVFNEIEAEMDSLKNEMSEIQAMIETKTAEYEGRIVRLNAEINSFNACAEVLGCFKTEAEFNRQRGDLIAERDALALIYDEISSLIEQYNAKVEQYNADVTRTEKLNQTINSIERVEGL